MKIKKYTPLADMVAPSIKDWKGVAENAKVSFQKRMKVEYRDKSYSNGYAKRKAAGKAKRKGTAQVSTSISPDLTLTGKMLQQIVATSTGTQAKLEFQNGSTVEGLDKQGKFPMFIGQNPASKSVDSDIEKYVNELYNRRVKKQTQKIVYKI